MVEQENRIREPENKVWQTRTHPQSDFEKRLAEALEKLFADGVTELNQLIERLNSEGVQDEDGRDWTEQSFRETMARNGG